MFAKGNVLAISKAAMFTVVFVVACLAYATPSAEATLLDLRIDLNQADTSPAGNWNVLTDPSNTSTVLNLIDYNTGAASGVTLQVTDAFIKSAGYFSAMDTWSASSFPWVDVVAIRDYAVLTSSDSAGQLTFSGLDAAKSYRVEVLGIRNQDFGYRGQVRVNGVLDDDHDEWFDCYSDGWVNGDGMLWGNVVPDAAGAITVHAETYSGLSFFVNACRISEVELPVSEVPEPSALVMLAFAMSGLIAYAWRKRN